jgi:hypothetical protein
MAMKLILFTDHFDKYVAGETAGFEDDQAAAIVARGVADYVEEVEQGDQDAEALAFLRTKGLNKREAAKRLKAEGAAKILADRDEQAAADEAGKQGDIVGDTQNGVKGDDQGAAQ